MAIPPVPPLDETIVAGQSGHIADHEAIADALNNDTASLTGDQTLSGAKTFLEGALLDKGNLAYFVKAYQATGLGIADDTAAIQDALDAAGAAGAGNGGAVVWANTGRYRVTKLVIPLGVKFLGPGIAGFSDSFRYGANIFQNAGTEDDMIVFENSTSGGRNFIGPCGVIGFELLGDTTATVGSGINFVNSAGANCTIQDTVEIAHNIIRGFAEDGIRVPEGALPFHPHDLNLLFNQGYGINYMSIANLTQAVHFDNISGDGNLGGALIRCAGADNRGSIVFTNIKSEKRINTDYGSVAGQENAILLEDCDGTAVFVGGLTHISSVPDGGVFEAPGAAIEIVASAPSLVPKVSWAGVAVRLRPGDTGAVQGPILRDVTNGVTVPNDEGAEGSYGYETTVAHPRAASSQLARWVFGGNGAYIGPSFPAPAFEIQGSAPAYVWHELDGAADQKTWLQALSGGGYTLRRYDDAGTLLETVTQVSASGDYAVSRAVANYTPFYLPVGGLFAVTGTPVLGTAGGGRRVVMLFDAAADELAAGSFVVPPGWQTASVTVLWVNAGAGAGSVMWVFQGDDFVEGDTINAADSQTVSGTEAAGAQDVVVSTPLATGSPVTLAAGRPFMYRIKRQGTDAGDTLANDAGLIGIVLTRLT